ncbi:MAG: NUDIX domain-containing protein [Bacteroidales bacterium]|nr:NUDIX domain-containing protein [Bacteroidales bacterium]
MKIIIRVYGLIINDRNQILLSDEFQLGTIMIKFPGGGLEPGEGPADCIKREAIEELGQEVEIISHFYTTDFFQKALFYENHQLVSIYYKVRLKKPIQFKISKKPFDFKEMIDGSQSFRWQSIEDLNIEELSFPIDKRVALMLKEGSA